MKSVQYWITLMSVGVLLLCPNMSYAESEFAPGERFIEEVVVDGIPISTAIAFAPDSRIFLAQKEGIVRVVENGKLLPTPFVDISTKVNKSTDRGLLGIAVDPRFPLRPFIYLSYVYDPPGYAQDSKDNRLIRVVRYQADAATGYAVAIPGSEEVILGKNSRPEFIARTVTSENVTYPEPASCMNGLTMAGQPIQDCIPCDALSHTAGTLLFGADGFLYASIGDGANYDRPSQVAFNAQSLDSMSGRVLRVDPDTGNGVPGNPFYEPSKPSSNRSRVWSYGFRNPFRITVNPNNGQVYVGDVGTSYYEEINVGKGANFGWPCYEGGFSERQQQEGRATISERQVGFKKSPATVEFCSNLYAAGVSKITAPLFTYRHPYDAAGKDLGSSITGLAMYTGSTYPVKYRGALFFADYARLFIRYLTFDSTGEPIAHNFAREVGANFGAVQLIIGPDGLLYAVYLDLKTRTSEVRRFRPLQGGNNPPIAKGSAGPSIGAAPLLVTFSASGSADPDGQPVTYLWDFGDGITSADPNPVHLYTKVGTYVATLTVSEATSPYATAKRSFTIRTGVNPPAAFIDSPPEGYQFEIGKEVAFQGHATPSAGVTIAWSLLQRHNQHEHLVSEMTGAGGSFVPEEHCDNCSYELCLSAQGEGGLLDQTCRPLLPKTARYTFASRPRGASITYIDEERETIAPYVAAPIVGSVQTIRAAQISNGRTFARWSDGQTSPVRTFKTGVAPKTFLAVYVNKPPRVSLRIIGAQSKKGAHVALSAAGSRDPERLPLSYTWKFSDGKVFRGGAVSRAFTRRGTYDLTLTVRDRVGGVTVYRASVIVGSYGRVSVRRRGVQRRVR